MTELKRLRQVAVSQEGVLADQAQRMAGIIMQPAVMRAESDLPYLIRSFSAARSAVFQTLGAFDTAARQTALLPAAGRPGAELRSDAEDRVFFDAVRHRYLLWDKVVPALGFMHDWAGAPLYVDPPPETTVWLQQFHATERAFAALHGVVNPHAQDTAAQEFGAFADIPMAPGLFMAHAHAALRVVRAQRRVGALRFLDVGCGGGMRVLQAAQLFNRADGLDLDPGYADAAATMLARATNGESRVYHADGITFADYALYDVIYYYRPMRSDDLLRRLEDKIVSDARPGTILIVPYRVPGSPVGTDACAQIEGAIHVVGLPQAEAADLGRAAQLMATIAMRFDGVTDPRAGYFAPLAQALAMNGYPVF